MTETYSFGKMIKQIGILAILLLSLNWLSDYRDSVEPKKTSIQVYNSTEDTIVAYLTLNDNGDDWKCDVNGIFGIKSKNKLQGAFRMLPKQKMVYTPNLPIAGNISFLHPPLNCPFPAPTLYEFTLNNYLTTSKAQETIDISCVFGVTTLGSISLIGGGTWNSGQNDTIRIVKNDSLYKNTGLKGVYPYGCTTCTGRQGMLDCENKKKYENVNTKSICNVQRDASKSGGIVRITYISNLKQ